MARREEEEDGESRKDIEMRRALEDLAKSVKEIKKKKWEQYKNIYPELYAEEFGIDKSISPQIQRIVDKEKEKYHNLKDENKRLKEDIKQLTKDYNKLFKFIEKLKKEIEKRDTEITKLRETSNKEINK